MIMQSYKADKAVKPKDRHPASYKFPYGFSKVYRFKITLKEVEPPVLRVIEVPGIYSFWDLHVALTDAFVWWDSHLHEWNIKNPKTGKKERLGIDYEDEYEGDPDVKMDWRVMIAHYFMKRKNPTAIYKYDFGDGWKHLVELEDIHPREAGVIYPRCVDGARACPPDDCGGPWGYQELLKVISDPTHEEYEEKIEWLGSMKGIDGEDFDPEHFNPAEVRFDDPFKRWNVAFDNMPMTPDMRMWDFIGEQVNREPERRG